MATVYLAEDIKHERKVALKVVFVEGVVIVVSIMLAFGIQAE